VGLIYHMLPEDEWLACQGKTSYAPASLRQEEFIHCTGEAEQMHVVANRFYRGERQKMLVLAIEETHVRAVIKWEEADGHLFPHIYGRLNLDAVMDVGILERGPNGEYLPLESER
jgi:uncharacterized protein (DUF952 family)